MEAAIADGILKGGNSNNMSNKGGVLNSAGKKASTIRRGKWTAEEEAYSNQLIQEFKAGLLPLTDGTTLRTFLSKLLNCDPMRISKKFVGGNCIGKQVFRRRQQDIDKLTFEQIEESRRLLSELERRFLERVAQTNRVKVPGVSLSSESGTFFLSFFPSFFPFLSFFLYFFPSFFLSFIPFFVPDFLLSFFYSCPSFIFSLFLSFIHPLFLSLFHSFTLSFILSFFLWLYIAHID